MFHEDKVYIWEAASSGNFPLVGDGIKNVDGNRTEFGCCFTCPEKYGFSGVQIRDLDELVGSSVETVDFYWGRADLTKIRTKTDPIRKLPHLIQNYNSIKYDWDTCCCINLLAAIFPCLRCCRDTVNLSNNQNKFFCSELVAAIYIEIGMLDGQVRPENVVPMDLFGFDMDFGDEGVRGVELFLEVVRFCKE